VEPVLNASPVDDLPDLLEIIWSEVLVLEVVGVFPDIDGEQGDLAVGGNEVLVFGLLDGESLGEGTVGEPAPARALDGGGLRVEQLHEVVVRAEVLVTLAYSVDRVGQRALVVWQDAAAVLRGRQVLPVPRVGLRAASVEPDLVAQLLHAGHVLGVDLGDQVLGMDVVLVDILLVMLLVMHLKNLSNEDGLQGIVRVWKLWQGNWAVFLLHWDY
jgi:hypothetical protein